MKPNEEVVAYRPEEDTEWGFVVPVRPDSVTGLLEETLSVVEDCYEGFSEFVSPKEVRCVVRSIEEDVEISDLESVNHGDCRDVGLTLSSSDGIALDEVTSVVRGLDDSTFPQKFVPTIQFNRPAVEIALADGVYDVGITSSHYVDPEGSGNPANPPLEVEIRTYEYADPPEITVSVFLNTDVWFEDTETGAANRRRLQEFLERMADVLDATDVDYWSNSHAIPFEIDV